MVSNKMRQITPSSASSARSLLGLLGINLCCATILVLMMRAQQNCFWKLIPINNESMEAHLFLYLMMIHAFVCFVGGLSLMTRALPVTRLFHFLLRISIIVNICSMPIYLKFLRDAQETIPAHLIDTAHEMISNGTKTEVCEFWRGIQHTMSCDSPVEICDWCTSGPREFCSPLKRGCAGPLIRFMNARVFTIVMFHMLRLCLDAWLLTNANRVYREMIDNEKFYEADEEKGATKNQKSVKSEKPKKSPKIQKVHKSEKAKMFQKTHFAVLIEDEESLYGSQILLLKNY